MSLRSSALVLAAALLTRAMPLAIGVLVATFFGPSDYADTVLMITAANLCGSLPMLAVTPLILRSPDDALATWLARRGVALGLPLILVAALLVSPVLNLVGNWVFLFCYSAAVFVFGVAQTLHNQRLDNLRALFHATAVTAAALFAAVATYLAGGAVWLVVNALAATMLAASLLSFALIRVAAKPQPKPHFASGALNALWSGLFSLLVIAGLFISASRARHAGDPDGYVAFSLGLQVFSIVVFIPGAMSGYFIPKLVRAGAETGTRIGPAVRAYLLLAVPAFCAAVALSPLFFRYLEQPPQPRLIAIFALIQFAAVLAAVNAAYNQVLVASGRFATLAMLSAGWLLTLVGVLWLRGDQTIWIAAAIALAYAALVFASRHACRSAWPRRKELA